MTKACAACGNPFEAKRSTAKFCTATCRQRGARPDASGVPQPRTMGTGLVVRTTEALVKAGRLDTYAGQQALALAERICSPFETGSAIASLSKELSRVMADALADAEQTSDPLDELRKRRDAKRVG